MKKKLTALLLIGILCLSLTACGESSVKTSQNDSSFEKKMLNIVDDKETDSDEETEDGQLEVPDAVKNISPEDDQALTGVLTEDSYTNEYFGLKLNKAEGGKIKSLMDPGTDLMPLSETYTEGIGSISIESRDADGNAYVSMNVSALSSKEQGKDGEVLAMEQFELEQSLNTAMDYEAECSFQTINIAGEEYPAYVEISDSEEGRKKAATIYIVKGEFKNIITVYAPEDRFDEMLQLIEKN
jgi:hypothetical protein